MTGKDIIGRLHLQEVFIGLIRIWLQLYIKTPVGSEKVWGNVWRRTFLHISRNSAIAVGEMPCVLYGDNKSWGEYKEDVTAWGNLAGLACLIGDVPVWREKIMLHSCT